MGLAGYVALEPISITTLLLAELTVETQLLESFKILTRWIQWKNIELISDVEDVAQ